MIIFLFALTNLAWLTLYLCMWSRCREWRRRAEEAEARLDDSIESRASMLRQRLDQAMEQWNQNSM